MLQLKPPSRRPRRQRWWPSLGQLLLVAFTWGLATMIVLAVAAVIEVGPVLYEINERHGIHAFDVLVATGMFCLSLLVTAWIVWPRRRWY